MKCVIPGWTLVLLLASAARFVSAEDSPPVDGDTKGAEPDSLVVLDEDREFWSFQRLAPVAPPRGEKPDAPRNVIDRFILAKLQERGLDLAPPADSHVFLRRASLDLLGLPPSEAEVDALPKKLTQGAVEQLIDRLLQSPHYGERQASLWIDVARFAESSGFEHDSNRPFAWQYRDFLVEAFNSNVPWDDMVRWQIAGDELAPQNPLAVKATGFLAAGVFPTQLTEAEFERARYDELDDMIGTLGVAMLGVSTGCARCHDHKFDPIPTSDYYQLAAVFATTIRAEQLVPVVPSVFQMQWESWEQQKARLQSKLARATSENDKKTIQEQLDDHLKQEPTEGKLPALICSEGTPPLKHHADGRGYPHFYPDVFHLHRGDVQQKQGVAEPGYLQVLSLHADQQHSEAREPPSATSETADGLSYRRSALAHWISDPQHGAGHLLSRVIVNRAWQQHFGRGIVATPNDFGMQGDRPTHPQLLDWLAYDLIANGWDLKRLHWQIMTSATYRQRSSNSTSQSSPDQEDHLLQHFPSRRLDAETIRDSLLQVSGQLDSTMYGPGSLSESMRRRSVYFTIKRSQPIPFMQVFDWPEHLVSIGRRARTTIAPQALALLNGPIVREYAAAFAALIETKRKETDDVAVAAAYRRAFGRAPTSEESRRAMHFIQAQRERYIAASLAPESALTDFCHALMGSNEFLFLP